VSSGLIMTATLSKGRSLGVAIYNTYSQGIEVLQGVDSAEGPRPFRLLRLLLLRRAPQIVCVPKGRPSEAFYAAVTDGTVEGGGAVQYEAASLFKPEKAVALVSALDVPGITSPGQSSRDRWSRLSSAAHLQGEEEKLAALGALVAILQREGLLEKGTARDPASVSALREMSLDDHVVLDVPTLHALSVIQVEQHPSKMGIGSSKEGFSLFGFMNNCQTPMGKALLRLLLCQPSRDLAEINARLDAVEFLATRPHTLAALQGTLKTVKDLTKLIDKCGSLSRSPPPECASTQDTSWPASGHLPSPARRPRRLQRSTGAFDVRDFASTRATLGSMLRLQSTFSTHLHDEDPGPGTCPPVSPRGLQPQSTQGLPSRTADSGSTPGEGDAAHSLPALLSSAWQALGAPEVAECHGLLSRVLESDESAEGLCLATGISDELDVMKRLWEQMPEILTRSVDEELLRVPQGLHRRLSGVWQVEYMPSVGYSMVVYGSIMAPEVLECLQDWELLFDSVDDVGNPVCYYRTASTEELNARYGDILHKIRDFETQLLVQVVQHLSSQRRALGAATGAVAECDALCSLAKAAGDFGLTRPVITAESILKIKGGWHLLSKLATRDAFISNDTDVGPTDGRVSVINGPNASGKSVYMKMVALICLMAHAGSFVPAESATVGLLDRILAKMPLPESVSSHRSSFMADLSQVSAMIQSATARSLAIIDELGKGTLASDGAGLLAAVVNHFARRAECPVVFVCTHFVEALREDFIPRSPQVAFFSMAAVVHFPSEGDGQGDVAFLYRLEEGAPSPSFGLKAARACGVPRAVTDRAAQVVAALGTARILGRFVDGRASARDGFAQATCALIRGADTSCCDIEALCARVLGLYAATPTGRALAGGSSDPPAASGPGGDGHRVTGGTVDSRLEAFEGDGALPGTETCAGGVCVTGADVASGGRALAVGAATERGGRPGAQLSGGIAKRHRMAGGSPSGATGA